MHKTKIGEFKYIVVIIHDQEDNGHNHLLCDKDEEVRNFIEQEMIKVQHRKPIIYILKDLNYLLNEMVKKKGTREGEALYSIYIDKYPDDDQKKKVIEFWNKEK